MLAFAGGLETAARIGVVTLFDTLWEAALLAVLVAAALRLFPNLSATTRYAAWSVALIAALLLPLATALPQVAVQNAQAPVVRSATRVSSVPAASAHTAHTAHAAVRAVMPRSAPAPAASAPFRLPERLHFSLPQYVALAIFAVWCLAAVLLLVRLAVNLWKLERIKSDALPLPVEYRERLERWSGADKGEREVRLCICEDIEVPVAVGLFDSMILIPKHLLETLSQSEVDQIILHELAHLRRADDWTNGAQRFIQALLFFNPAVLYIAQQLDLEREVACDDWVVDQTKEVRPYATCLTKMAEATAWPHRPVAAPGVFVTRRGLSVRVERLLRAGRNIRTSVAFGPTGAIVAALVVLFFVLQNVAPTFAFTMNAPQRQVALAAATASPAKTAPPTASPKPRATTLTIDVPARHVDVPGRHIDIPAQHIDIPAKHFVVTVPSMPPMPKVHDTMPPAFYAKMRAVASVSQSVGKSISQAMSQAFGAAGGHFDCVGCDYSGQNLAGRSFRGRRLNGADFTRANLRNADFSNSVLVGADFSHADLTGANFTNAKLTGCDFSHSQIGGVNFAGVQMIGCDFNARSLAPAQAANLLRGCRTGCDFSHANLSGQDLRNLDATGLDLSHANLRGADLSGSRLEGVDFSGAVLDGARFDRASLTGCDFSGVDLHNVDLSTATITGSTMSGSRFR